jgi:hypothetical protein
MSDTPPNSGDQPVPFGQPSQEPFAPQPADPQVPQTPAYQPPAWIPPVTQQPAWTPPPAPAAPMAPQPAWTPPPAPPAPFAPQPAWTPQAPVTDPNQGWQPQQQAPAQQAPAQQASAQQAYGNAYGQPAQQAPKSGGKLWQIVSIVLVVLLLAVGGGLGFAYMSTTSDLNKTKDSLAAEQAAHKAEQAAHKKDNAAYGACVASMKTDDTALAAAMTALTAVTDSPATGGSIDTARKQYETDLLAAEKDFQNAAYYYYEGVTTSSAAMFNEGTAPYNRALDEFKTAQADLVTLDGLISHYTDAVSAAEAQVTAAQAQMAKTATQCAAASSGAASSASAAPSK